MRTILLIGLMSSLAAACGDDSGTADTADTGATSDVGSSDARIESDTGTEDDAGGSDTGPMADAGPSADTGTDGGPNVDAGTDAGSTMCGGFVGGECDRSEFCEYSMGCGFDDRSGTCTVRPEACPRVLDPVCGCDGNDYGNPCMARMAGQSVASTGPCEGTRCGGRLGATCGRSEFCAFGRDDMCGRMDASSTCMDRPLACPGVFLPVCGCDGNDYGNECQANAAGVAVFRDGNCSDGP